MADWERLRRRYSQLDWQQRLGNLASTINRAASAAANPRTAASVGEMLREGMWIIEWSRDDTPLEALTELAEVQRELGFLRTAWQQDQDAVRLLVAFRARALAGRTLELSGLEV